jgi:hypothetical protein
MHNHQGLETNSRFQGSQELLGVWGNTTNYISLKSVKGIEREREQRDKSYTSQQQFSELNLILINSLSPTTVFCLSKCSFYEIFGNIWKAKLLILFYNVETFCYLWIHGTTFIVTMQYLVLWNRMCFAPLTPLLLYEFMGRDVPVLVPTTSTSSAARMRMSLV